MNEKKRVSLTRLLLYTLTVVLCIGVAMYQAEIKIAEVRYRESITENLTSLRESVRKAYYDDESIARLWRNTGWSAVEALSWLYDMDGELPDDQTLYTKFNVFNAYITDDGEVEKRVGYEYFDWAASDGKIITVEKDRISLAVIQT